MKIERDEINKMKKFLTKIPYAKSADSKASIVFPISNVEVKDYDGIQMVSGLNKETSIVAEPDAVLLLNLSKDGDSYVQLAYCDLRFARKFDLKSHCELLGDSLPKQLNNIEAMILQDDYILAKFYI